MQESHPEVKKGKKKEEREGVREGAREDLLNV